MSDGFNQVDRTCRGDFRELNQLNFARFDAKLEQRVTQLAARLEQGLAALRGEFRDELHAQSRVLMRWMVGLWMTAMGFLSGLIFAGLHFLPLARP